MTPEIENKISQEANWRSTDGHGVVHNLVLHNFTQGAEYGYSLAEKEIKGLRVQVSAYKTLTEAGDKIRNHQNKLLSEAKTVDSEREANEILTNEIDRLKELLRRQIVLDGNFKHNLDAWEQYKKQNNL